MELGTTQAPLIQSASPLVTLTVSATQVLLVCQVTDTGGLNNKDIDTLHKKQPTPVTGNYSVDH